MSRHAAGLTLVGTFVVVVLLVASLLATVPASGHAAGPLRPAEVSPGGMVCQAADYASAHLRVSTSDCQALFSVEFGNNLSAWNATDQWNFSFAISWIAEITPAGQVVRVATPLAPYQGSANVTTRGNEVVLYDTETMNVTNASGGWTPADTGYGDGPPWTVSTTKVGITTMEVNWYVTGAAANGTENGTGNLSDRVEFSLAISGWPWVSSSDFLGFELDSLGAWGAHFGYNSSSRTLTEDWNTTGRTFASLVFGSNATVGGWPSPGGGGPNTTGESRLPAAAATRDSPTDLNPNATVAVQAGVFTAGSPGREAVCLATFENVSGNYSGLSYDPWVVFTPSAGVTFPPPLGNGPVGGNGLPSWAPVALGVVAGVAALGTIAAAVARERRLHAEGVTLVRGIRSALHDVPPPPKGSM